MNISHLLKSDFITYRDQIITFDLDFTHKKSLEAGGQIFRSLLAYIFKLAIEYPNESFAIKIINIRKGRKPKTGMRQQHMECVTILKCILDSCNRYIELGQDFKEESEVLTLEFYESPEFNIKNIKTNYEFGIGKINPKTQKPSEEAASLILQFCIYIMIILDSNLEWDIQIGGGLNMSWSPDIYFCENILSEVTGFTIKCTQLFGKTGIISITGKKNLKIPKIITSKYLFDQVIFMIANTNKDPDIKYSCEVTNHTRSQIYLCSILYDY